MKVSKHIAQIYKTHTFQNRSPVSLRGCIYETPSRIAAQIAPSLTSVDGTDGRAGGYSLLTYR